MKTNTTKYNYVEWLSAEEMHDTSRRWLSELKFIRDEQLFLNDLVKSYTLQLIDKDIFEKSKKVVDELQQAEKEVASLIKKVQVHENQLEAMIDDMDQPKMEKAYIETHKELLVAKETYHTQYRKIKENIFLVVSAIMKKERQKRLLN